jgi:drug/metabolite transporter (DMT)-like permease
MFRPEYIFLLATVFLNGAGTLLVKKGADAIPETAPVKTIQGIIAHVLPAFNIYSISGLGLLVLSFLTFFLVLSKVNVSIAQPMLSMSYIVVLIGAYFIFSEPVSPMKLAGIGCIIAGVFLLSAARV